MLKKVSENKIEYADQNVDLKQIVASFKLSENQGLIQALEKAAFDYMV